jgi:hypothetical protein
MRGSWFAGRVLQQLTVFHDPQYVPLLSNAWFGGSWKTDTTIALACRLTSANPDDSFDWRFVRTNHVYNIGALSFHIRPLTPYFALAFRADFPALWHALIFFLIPSSIYAPTHWSTS